MTGSPSEDYDPYTMLDAPRSVRRRLRAHLAHRMTRAYVVSFPKSGRTWLRMLLAHYFARIYGVAVDPEITDQWRENPRIPATRFTHLGSDKPEPRERSFNFRRYARKRVIYLYRDPRDVVTSYYFHVNRRWGKTPRGLRSVAEFIRDERYGIRRVVGFMNLVAQNLDVWSRVRLLKYETLHRDGAVELAELIRHITGKAANDEAVRQAIDACAFSKMRRMEVRSEIEHDALQPGDVDDPQSFKVREGKVGGHERYLSKSDIEFIDEYVERTLHPMYESYRRGISV